MKTYLIAIGAIILCALGIWFMQRNSTTQDSTTQTQESSESETAEAKENKPVAQKPQPTPRPVSTTLTPSPTTTTPPAPALKATYVNTDEKDIFNVLPRPGETVSPSITISGAARGNWFQQGTFIAEIIAPNGDVLVRNNIPAEGNYMTTEMVQFSSAVLITVQYRGPATLILSNDNPPGHPVPDRSVSIPIVIK